VPRGGQQTIPRPDGWTPGASNPWTPHVRNASFALPDIETRLARHRDARALPGGIALNDLIPTTPMRPPFVNVAKDAAVLLPLFVDEGGDTRLLLTRRSGRLRNHRGEVAFPGGRLDANETPIEAALREAEEEIGLPRHAVRIVGELESLTTVVSSSRITPLVGVVDDMTSLLPSLRPNPGEVDRIFSVTLDELTDPDCYREEIWAFADGTFPVWFFEVEDDTIWGATGRMIRRLLDLTIL
jgi:8-oxo-dGTP pyrophosphatase MutT (NUDIX family)